MSGRLFEANRLNHDDDFLQEPQFREGREDTAKRNRPPKPARNNTSVGGCKWLGPNPSGNGYSTTSHTDQPRDHRQTNAVDPTVLKTSASNIQGDDFAIESSAWTQETGREVADSPSIWGKPNYYPTTKFTSDPPPLVEEEEGRTHPISISLPSLIGNDLRIEQDGHSSIAKSNEYERENTSSAGSLHYFTPNSSLLSTTSQDDAEQTRVQAAEARIIAALNAMDKDDFQDMDFLLDMSLDSTLLCEYIGATTSGLSLSIASNNTFDSINNDEGDFSYNEQESTSITTSLELKPPETYKFRSIDTFFRPVRKQINTADDCSVIDEQQGKIIPSVVAVQCIKVRKRRRQSKMIAHPILSEHCPRRYGKHNNSSGDKQRSYATICFHNQFQSVSTIGTAIETIELLRRCFYPRREVIKWEYLEIGISCLLRLVSIEDTLYLRALNKTLLYG